jgi:hypothetical protein
VGGIAVEEHAGNGPQPPAHESIGSRRPCSPGARAELQPNGSQSPADQPAIRLPAATNQEGLETGNGDNGSQHTSCADPSCTRSLPRTMCLERMTNEELIALEASLKAQRDLLGVKREDEGKMKNARAKCKLRRTRCWEVPVSSLSVVRGTFPVAGEEPCRPVGRSVFHPCSIRGVVRVGPFCRNGLKAVEVLRGLPSSRWPATLVHLGKMDLQGSLPAIAQDCPNSVVVGKLSAVIAFYCPIATDSCHTQRGMH